MAHAPECSGEVYGCVRCGREGLTIEQSFDHECTPTVPWKKTTKCVVYGPRCGGCWHCDPLPNQWKEGGGKA